MAFLLISLVLGITLIVGSALAAGRSLNTLVREADAIRRNGSQCPSCEYDPGIRAEAGKCPECGLTWGEALGAASRPRLLSALWPLAGGLLSLLVFAAISRDLTVGGAVWFGIMMLPPFAMLACFLIRSGVTCHPHLTRRLTIVVGIVLLLLTLLGYLPLALRKPGSGGYDLDLLFVPLLNAMIGLGLTGVVTAAAAAVLRRRQERRRLERGL